MFHKMQSVEEHFSTHSSVSLTSRDSILWSTCCKPHLFSPAANGERLNKLSPAGSVQGMT
jgi:hypothetical protein